MYNANQFVWAHVHRWFDYSNLLSTQPGESAKGSIAFLLFFAGPRPAYAGMELFLQCVIREYPLQALPAGLARFCCITFSHRMTAMIRPSVNQLQNLFSDCGRATVKTRWLLCSNVLLGPNLGEFLRDQLGVFLLGRLREMLWRSPFSPGFLPVRTWPRTRKCCNLPRTTEFLLARTGFLSDPEWAETQTSFPGVKVRKTRRHVP